MDKGVPPLLGAVETTLERVARCRGGSFEADIVKEDDKDGEEAVSQNIDRFE